ncbi:MAG: DUF4012 domain-containing protein [Micrococcaceae bacterium]
MGYDYSTNQDYFSSEWTGKPSKGKKKKRSSSSKKKKRRSSHTPKRSNMFRNLMYFFAFLALLLIWLGIRGMQAANALEKISNAAPTLKADIATGDPNKISNSLGNIQAAASSAHSATSDPVWRAAKYMPLLGANFQALSAISDTAYGLTHGVNSDVVNKVMNFKEVMKPQNGQFNMDELKSLSNQLGSSFDEANQGIDQLASINANSLVSPLRAKFTNAQQQILPLAPTVKTTGTMIKLMPTLLGGNGHRSYFLANQGLNELRGSGGHAGSLALVSADNGKISIDKNYSLIQFSTADKYINSPVDIPDSIANTYDPKMKYDMVTFNASPDWPTDSKVAHDLFQKETGTDVDGVIAMDPVALSYILQATGPVTLDESISGVDNTLTSDNAAQVLLSDAYVTSDSDQQHEFFADAVNKTFDKIKAGTFDPTKLADAFTRSSNEHRFLMWSKHDDEQKLLGPLASGGDTLQPVEAAPSAMYGIAINNLQQSKMDYYIKDNVQISQNGCGVSPSNTTTIKYQVSNTFQGDASSLPSYVLSDSAKHGTPGELYDNYTFYAPKGTEMQTVKVDGQAVGSQNTKPLDLSAVTIPLHIGQGQTKTVEVTFGNTDLTQKPGIRLTPTAQDLDSRIKEPTIEATCGK